MNNLKRRTIYLEQETLDYIDLLQKAYTEEIEHWPPISKSKWITVLIRSGIQTMRGQIQELQEI